MHEFHAAIYAWFSVLLDRPHALWRITCPPSRALEDYDLPALTRTGGLLPAEGSDESGLNSKMGEQLKMKAQVKSTLAAQLPNAVCE